MRILVIAPDVFYEGKMGNSVHLHELVHNLMKSNDVRVIARSSGRKGRHEKNIYLIKGIDKPLLHTITYAVSGFVKGCKLLFGDKVDIIYERHHVFGTGVILGKLWGIPVVSEMNGLLIDEAEVSGSYGEIIQKIVKVIEKFVLRHVDKIVAVSSEIKKEVIKKIYNIPAEKIVVIENGANIDLFRPINKEDAKRDLDENYIYVGLSGSFAPWHGIEDLVRSAPLILKKVENTKFLLVGDGPMKEQVIQMVNDLNLTGNFIFIDRVHYEEVPKYVNAFDVCVILKKKDVPGSPLKLWEYMACGKPVIATNTEDFRVLEEYNAGILVDPEKTEEVADAIITLLKNKELRDEMGKNGRKYVVENRSWERVAREVEKVMKEAASK